MLEEKCFPTLFPYGFGGYLSSNMISKHGTKGFAKYIKERIKSADPKYREDYSYIFFLLQVRDAIELKRCRSTYLRQARKVPNLSKEDIRSTKKIDLARYNRSFQVFKTMRGTSMYFENSKKKLMAMLRQEGAPSVFMTVSCAEYKWKELVRQILETERKRHVNMEEVNKLSDKERHAIISRSAIESTCHFQKRVEKLFHLLQYENEAIFEGFKVKDYFYRIEFQARGAPHLHSLLWLEDVKTMEPPTSFWNTNDLKKSKLPQDIQDFLKETSEAENPNLTENNGENCEPDDQNESQLERDLKRKQKITDFAKKVVFGSLQDAKCHEHTYTSSENDFLKCEKCQTIRERVESYNKHSCSFTCHKKKKIIRINKNEGHGRLDNTDQVEGGEMEIPSCRFGIPFFPMDVTTFLEGRTKANIPEDEDLRKKEEQEHIESKKDFKKIKKFLLRQSYGHKENSESWNNLKQLDFDTFF